MFFALTSEVLTAPEACTELQVNDLFYILQHFSIALQTASGGGTQATWASLAPAAALFPASPLPLEGFVGSWAAFDF